MTVDDLSLRDTLRRLTNGFQVSQAIHVAASLRIADLLSNALDRSKIWPRQPGRPQRPLPGCYGPSRALEFSPRKAVGLDKRRSPITCARM